MSDIREYLEGKKELTDVTEEALPVQVQKNDIWGVLVNSLDADVEKDRTDGLSVQFNEPDMKDLFIRVASNTEDKYSMSVSDLDSRERLDQLAFNSESVMSNMLPNDIQKISEGRY